MRTYSFRVTGHCSKTGDSTPNNWWSSETAYIENNSLESIHLTGYSTDPINDLVYAIRNYSTYPGSSAYLI